MNHKIRNKAGDGFDLGYNTYNHGETAGSGYGGPGGPQFGCTRSNMAFTTVWMCKLKLAGPHG